MRQNDLREHLDSLGQAGGVGDQPGQPTTNKIYSGGVATVALPAPEDVPAPRAFALTNFGPGSTASFKAPPPTLGASSTDHGTQETQRAEGWLADGGPVPARVFDANTGEWVAPRR